MLYLVVLLYCPVLAGLIFFSVHPNIATLLRLIHYLITNLLLTILMFNYLSTRPLTGPEISLADYVELRQLVHGNKQKSELFLFYLGNDGKIVEREAAIIRNME